LVSGGCTPAMAPPKESEPALAAPGIGQLTVPPPTLVQGPRANRRTRARPYQHVHLELDLAPRPRDPTGVPILEELAALLRERKVVEQGSLVLLAAATLHALASRGFRRVDHWEFAPGGWLPLPDAARGRRSEPVGQLVRALEPGGWGAAGTARVFSARLSGIAGARADVVVRRVHRERRHALSIDLRGTWTKATVQDVVDALAARLPVVRSEMTKFMYAGDA
jgi:hypothetical protein